MIVKRDSAPAKAKKLTRKQAAPEDLSAAELRDLTPRPGMQDDDLREQRAERSRAAGVEVVAGAPLRRSAGMPTDLRHYGDWVNLEFPADTPSRAGAAISRFKRVAARRYREDRSMRIVFERIARAALASGAELPLGEKPDRFDMMLPQDLREQLRAEAGRQKAEKAKASRDAFRHAAAAAVGLAAARPAPARTIKKTYRRPARARVETSSVLPEAGPQVGAIDRVFWPSDLNDLNER